MKSTIALWITSVITSVAVVVAISTSMHAIYICDRFEKSEASVAALSRMNERSRHQIDESRAEISKLINNMDAWRTECGNLRNSLKEGGLYADHNGILVLEKHAK
jgi:hypothetical protein